ncbi:hypothetical protein COXBURSA331_A0137 [Coxiella burnetii RSA 331]|nr:hypothetical protein COXBURSA331_A0137 [Coxiella burnetii RSA 331]EDR35258.1 hypothetical protein COXBURSA334_2034 [Coxiella burnetii Q321]MDE3401175.1 hypothetical protein [Coxiella burnetii]
MQIIGNLKRSYDHAGIRVTSPMEFFVDSPWREYGFNSLEDI